MIYEMATGKQAFLGATAGVIFDQILERQPAPPSQLKSRSADEARGNYREGAREGFEAALSLAGDMRAGLQRLKRAMESGRSGLRFALADRIQVLLQVRHR